MKNTDYITILEQNSLSFWCSISEKNHISVTVQNCQWLAENNVVNELWLRAIWNCACRETLAPNVLPSIAMPSMRFISVKGTEAFHHRGGWGGSASHRVRATLENR